MFLLNIFKIIIKFFTWVSVLASVLMLALIVLDVILRTFFKAPIVGATELIQMLMVCILAAVGGCIIENRNTRVDVILDLLPKKVAFIIDFAGYVISIAFFLLIAWQTFESALFSASFDIVYSLLGIPEYPFLALLAFSFLIGVAATFVVLFNHIKNKNGGERV